MADVESGCAVRATLYSIGVTGVRSSAECVFWVYSTSALGSKRALEEQALYATNAVLEVNGSPGAPLILNGINGFMTASSNLTTVFDKDLIPATAATSKIVKHFCGHSGLQLCRC